MATVPRYTVSQSSPRAVGVGNAVASDDVARGLYQVADAVEQRNRTRDIAYVANQSATDRLALNQHLNDLIAQAPPDGAGVADGILQRIDEQEKATLTAAPSNGARAFLSQHYAQLRTQMGVSAQNFEAEARGKYTVQQLKEAVDSNAVFLSTSPGSFELIKGETDITLNALGANAGMNPAAIEAFKKEAYQTLATSAIAGAIQTNPIGALHALSTGQFDQYFTDPAKKIALINSSLAQYTEIQNQQYRDEQRALKFDAQQAALEGIKLANSGQLTPAWLEANADRFASSPSTLLTLQNQIGKGLTLTDPTLYSDLRIRSASGENVAAEATDAFMAGRMKQEDYDRIVSASTAASGGPASPYKQGESYIADSLAKSIYDTAGFSTAKQQTADALDEYNQWYAEHPKATPKEVRERYLSIVDDWRNAKLVGLRAVPQPRFAVYTPNGLFAAQETFKQTVEAFERGDITERERDEQGMIIFSFDSILNPPKAPEAQKP